MVERSNRPSPAIIAEAVSKQYADKPYISFRSHIENHESILGGWSVKPGGSISPGTVFDVHMSSSGDLCVLMLMDSEPVYEYRVAVLDRNASDEGNDQNYIVHEYDHKNKVRTENRILDAEPRSMILSHEALDHPSWCASGGYMITFIGASGKVADLDNEDSFAYEIARGSFDRHEQLPDGGKAIVIRFIQQEAAGPGKGPQGQDLPARPKIWWDIYVDADKDLIVQKDGYFEKPGEKPVLVRRARYTDIEFPTQVDEEAVFRAVPEAAKSYRVWKPGEPYPGTRLESGS